MGVRQFKPVTPSSRSRSIPDFSEITRTTGEKSLMEPLTKSGGRDNHGHIAMRRIGNALPLREIPLGTDVHNVELKPGAGGKMARSAGTKVEVVAKEGEYVTLRMASSEMR